jgi:hypothetical protein
MSPQLATTESRILERIIAPENGSWSPEAARSILALRIPDSDVRRMEELAAKANAGVLSDNERSEAETYNRAGLLLDLLQSKARQSLSRRDAV